MVPGGVKFYKKVLETFQNWKSKELEKWKTIEFNESGHV